MKNTTAIILAAVIGAAGLYLVVQIKDKGVTDDVYRVILGAFLLTAFLMLLAEILPDVARGLSLVILLTAVVMNGGQFFKLITSLVD